MINHDFPVWLKNIRTLHKLTKLTFEKLSNILISKKINKNLILNNVIICTAGVLFKVIYVCHWDFPTCYFYKKKGQFSTTTKKIKCHHRRWYGCLCRHTVMALNKMLSNLSVVLYKTLMTIEAPGTSLSVTRVNYSFGASGCILQIKMYLHHMTMSVNCSPTNKSGVWFQRLFLKERFMIQSHKSTNKWKMILLKDSLG